MNRQNTQCSDELLLKLLHSDQGDDEDVDGTAHLETCPRCQARFETLAAAPQDWRLVQESLSSSDAAGEDDSPRGTWAKGRWQRVPLAWSESMARQLLSPPSHPEMLGRIGRYEVERIVGSGGMGVVFKAFDTELNRPVAVKVLAPFLAGSGTARKRFAREARAAAAIVHEHVVAIHNVETEGESPFLVMHYVAGESLQQRLDRDGPLDLCVILRIGMQTAAGLAAAHAQGLVHRDVKPSNILLEHGIERTLLTDFGLARASDDASLTHSGYHPGTPQYMSPEQARGDAVDARSDLFSLGSVIYTLCVGHPPFRAESAYGILRRITDNAPRPIREINPVIPDWLCMIIARLLSKQASDRYQSAAEVAALFESCLAHVQQPTVAPLPRSLEVHAGDHRVHAISRRTTGVIAAIVFLGLCCWGINSWLGSIPLDQRLPKDQMENNTETQALPAIATVNVPWNDGTTEQVGDLQNRADVLEKQTQKLWHEPAATLLDQFHPETFPNSKREMTP
ncbi:MAG: serine/threonine-protein kinase [Planctomycetota bacterium]|nr:serine/threonine-protein kinase [Planctomycetota bacterium]